MAAAYQIPPAHTGVQSFSWRFLGKEISLFPSQRNLFRWAHFHLLIINSMTVSPNIAFFRVRNLNTLFSALTNSTMRKKMFAACSLGSLVGFAVASLSPSRLLRTALRAWTAVSLVLPALGLGLLLLKPSQKFEVFLWAGKEEAKRLLNFVICVPDEVRLIEIPAAELPPPEDW